MMQIRVINAPTDDVLQILARRVAHDIRPRLLGSGVDAIGLVQCSVVDVLFFADVAEKAADVVATEMFGNCPQHITSLAVFGTTSAVRNAMEAIIGQPGEARGGAGTKNF